MVISTGGSSIRLRTSPITQPAANPTATPPRRDDKVERRLAERERSTHGGGDRDAVRDQRGGVVDQALALHDRDDPARHADAPHDRRRRDRVGR